MASFVANSSPGERHAIGHLRVVFGVLTIASGDTYTAEDGVEVTPSMFGLDKLLEIIPQGVMVQAGSPDTAVIPSWNRADSSVRLFIGNGTSELAELTSVGANYVGPVMVCGH